MNLYDLFENQQSIKWVIPKSCRRSIDSGSEVVVWIDPRKLDPEWKRDTGFYVGPNGSNNSIGDRYQRFGEWLKQGLAVEMPEVGFGYNDIPVFTNGRHRYAWMRDHGVTAIPIVTDLSRSKEFQEIFGTSSRKTILSL